MLTDELVSNPLYNVMRRLRKFHVIQSTWNINTLQNKPPSEISLGWPRQETSNGTHAGSKSIYGTRVIVCAGTFSKPGWNIAGEGGGVRKETNPIKTVQGGVSLSLFDFRFVVITLKWKFKYCFKEYIIGWTRLHIEKWQKQLCGHNFYINSRVREWNQPFRVYETIKYVRSRGAMLWKDVTQR